MRNFPMKLKRREKQKFNQKMPHVVVDENSYPTFPIESVPIYSKKDRFKLYRNRDHQSDEIGLETIVSVFTA